MGASRPAGRTSPVVWLFLYSVGTMTVFALVLASQTGPGRDFVVAVGQGSLRILASAHEGGVETWAYFSPHLEGARTRVLSIWTGLTSRFG